MATSKKLEVTVVPIEATAQWLLIPDGQVYDQSKLIDHQDLPVVGDVDPESKLTLITKSVEPFGSNYVVTGLYIKDNRKTGN